MPSHGFYPDNPKELRNMINSFVESGKNIEQIPNAVGCVLPHAGYIFSGSIAMHTLMASAPTQKKFLIIGPDHYGAGSGKPSSEEHSTDVEIPLVKELNENAEIKQIVIGTETDYDDLKKMAKEIAEKDTFYIASSDFIHFGPNYGYMPHESGSSNKERVEWVKETDTKLAKIITSFDAKKFYKTIEGNYSVCGYKAITLVMLIAKALGVKQAKIIEHKTSYDVVPSESFVDYMGIVFY